MKQMNAATLKSRTSRPGPEQDMVYAALHQGLPFVDQDTRFFMEPQLPVGFPDIVAVTHNSVRLARDSNPILSSDHVRVLHHIFIRRSSTVVELQTDLLLPRKKAITILSDLLNAMCLYKSGNRFFIRSLEKIFALREIIAVEAKISDWRAAIRQAINNTWFASHSYILIPTRSDFSKVVSESKKFGIGVILHSASKNEVVARPQKYKIPASYGSWLFNEWMLDHSAKNVWYR